MALKDLVHDAETWKRVFKDENAKKESKASIKRTRDGTDYESQNIFCQEYCENHFKDHPNAKPSEVNDAAVEEWSSMTDAERAVYSNRCIKRWKELEKIYLRLLNDKAFKKFRKYI